MTEENLVQEAQKAAERIEKANAEMRELMKKQEAAEALRIMSGRSAAGVPQAPVMSEDEKLRIEMKQFFAGTAVERAIK